MVEPKKRIGYWRQTEDSTDDLPYPNTIEKLPDDTKQKILTYLSKGTVDVAWMGYSTCKLCGCQNGSSCLTDEIFVWPEGYAHYIDVHDVAVDPELLAHILTQPA